MVTDSCTFLKVPRNWVQINVCSKSNISKWEADARAVRPSMTRVRCSSCVRMARMAETFQGYSGREGQSIHHFLDSQADKKSPFFASDYGMIEQTIRISSEPLILGVHQEALMDIQLFVQNLQAEMAKIKPPAPPPPPSSLPLTKSGSGLQRLISHVSSTNLSVKSMTSKVFFYRFERENCEFFRFFFCPLEQKMSIFLFSRWTKKT